MYCPLYYVLLFSQGELGWSPHNAKVGQEVDAQRQNGDDDNEEEDKGEDENENNEDTGTSIIQHVTQSEYFAYRLHVRRSNEKVNSINASGIPLSELNLKVGCPIMILCNLDPANGLCNGARAIVTEVASCVLEVCLIEGEHDGETHFIPCITLSPPVEAIGFQLSRHQFPAQLAFAMTINKSQGQSVKYIGINFQTPVFTHG